MRQLRRIFWWYPPTQFPKSHKEEVHMFVSKISRVMLVVALLVLGVWLLSFSSGPGAETAARQQAIHRLIEMIEKPDESFPRVDVELELVIRETA